VREGEIRKGEDIIEGNPKPAAVTWEKKDLLLPPSSPSQKGAGIRRIGPVSKNPEKIPVSEMVLRPKCASEDKTGAYHLMWFYPAAIHESTP